MISALILPDCQVVLYEKEPTLPGPDAVIAQEEWHSSIWSPNRPALGKRTCSCEMELLFPLLLDWPKWKEASNIQIMFTVFPNLTMLQLYGWLSPSPIGVMVNFANFNPKTGEECGPEYHSPPMPEEDNLNSN